jgi:hypothetical protein
MPVQVDPLDSLQPRVMEKARQMVSHCTGARGLGGQRKSGIFIEQIQILRAKLAGTTEDLHGPANDTGTSQEMNQRLAIEVDVENETLVSDANPNFTFRRLEAPADAAAGYFALVQVFVQEPAELIVNLKNDTHELSVQSMKRLLIAGLNRSTDFDRHSATCCRA